MWKCKKCGGEHFTETITGGYHSGIFNEYGELVTCYEEYLDFGEVTCQKCNNTGTEIKEIAHWEED